MLFSGTVYHRLGNPRLFEERYADLDGPEQVQPALQEDTRTIRVKVMWRFDEQQQLVTSDG